MTYNYTLYRVICVLLVHFIFTVCVYCQVDTAFLRKLEMPDALKNVSIRDLVADSAGVLYLATDHGIFMKRGDRAQLLEGTAGMDATSIHRDIQGTIWSAVNVGELFCSSSAHIELFNFIKSQNPVRISVFPTSHPQYFSFTIRKFPSKITNVMHVYDLFSKKIVLSKSTNMHYNAGAQYKTPGEMWIPADSNGNLSFSKYSIDSFSYSGQSLFKTTSQNRLTTCTSSENILIAYEGSSNMWTSHTCKWNESSTLQPLSEQVIRALMLQENDVYYIIKNQLYKNQNEVLSAPNLGYIREDHMNTIYVISRDNNLYKLVEFEKEITSKRIVHTFQDLSDIIKENQVLVSKNHQNSNDITVSQVNRILFQNRQFKINNVSGTCITDRSGNYFITDHNNYLIRLNDLQRQKINISAKIFMSAALNDSTLILGTSNGLYTYDLNSQTTLLLSGSSGQYITKLVYDSNYIFHTIGLDSVVMRTVNGTIWKIYQPGISDLMVDNHSLYIHTEGGIVKVNVGMTPHLQTLYTTADLPLTKEPRKCFLVDGQFHFIQNDLQFKLPIPRSSAKSIYLTIEDVYVNGSKVENGKIQVRRGLNKLMIHYIISSNTHIEQLDVQLKSTNYLLSDIQENFGKVSAYFYGDQLHNPELALTINDLYNLKETVSLRVHYSFYENNRVLIWTLGATSIILFGFLLYSQYNRQLISSREKRSVLKLNLLNSKLNPHFIFNAFSLLNANISSKDHNSLVTNLTSLIRKVFYSSNHHFVTIDEELKLVESLLTVQKIRRQELFDYSIEISDGLNPSTLAIPNMTLFTFAENSIIHGFRDGKQKMQINIQIGQWDDYIMISLEDNGIGLTGSKSRASRGFSSGIKSLKERFKLFEQLYGIEYNFIVMNSMVSKNNIEGTTCIIYFKTQEIV